ncbi:hypothetical protein ElyMa_006742500 [Elysia marginata]|uniref:Uncharacterized protein n=1 Tax=Elysia marginata TaxID=1093978 RepID=A0AAV4J0I2_9GAST|nr:hypothetical protein ElyMa_006742500 [Elysia marginata]
MVQVKWEVNLGQLDRTKKDRTKSHQECEIFSGRKHEAAESEHKFSSCEKNPGHEQFVSPQHFIEKCLSRLQTEEKREVFRAWIDLTVRLRVYCTSRDRPDDDDMATYRGTAGARVGTGFLWLVSTPRYDKSCFCDKCHGMVAKKQWTFEVQTARHVVYNTEEAKRTKVDLFYDDHSCQQDCRMKSLRGEELVISSSSRDWCIMSCVVCDEDLVERIKSLIVKRCWRLYLDTGRLNLNEFKLDPQDFYELGLLQSRGEDCDPVLIVSHPHGQPKKITLGENKYRDTEQFLVEYNTPTCPGSSGAPVFLYGRNQKMSTTVCLYSPVHSGSYGEISIEHKIQPKLYKRLLDKISGHKPTIEQLNFGNYC